MNVKRKTVRFQDNSSDLSAYEAISNYKTYGFRSESHMIIEAVRRLIGDKSDLDPEYLADLIAKRLSGKLNVECKAEEPPKEETGTKEAAFSAALDFLNNL